MANPGDSLRSVWTAAFYNQLAQLIKAQARVTGANGAQVSGGKNGLQIVLPPNVNQLSTLQGVLTGGDAPPVTDGTVVIDLYAWAGYTIQAAAFILATGTTTISVQVNGTAVSWLDALAITTAGLVTPIPSPPPDLTHIIKQGDQLTIVISSSSSDATGLAFSLYTPF